MSRLVGLGVHIDFHKFDTGLAQIGFDPIGFHQHFRMRVFCHNSILSLYPFQV